MILIVSLQFPNLPHTATKLPTVWASGDYYEKQSFQNMLFPHGLAYDSKIEHYRTPKVNSVFGCVADLSKLLEGNKKGDSQFLLDKSPTVPLTDRKPNQISKSIKKINALRLKIKL